MILEAVARKCSIKNVSLKTSQNSQENTCARVSFGKVCASNSTKNGLRHKRFHKFSENPRTSALQNICGD